MYRQDNSNNVYIYNGEGSHSYCKLSPLLLSDTPEADNVWNIYHPDFNRMDISGIVERE